MASIYVLPIDPTSPTSQAVSDLDTAKLWSSVPSGAKPPKAGTARVFFGAGTQNGSIAALASLGDNFGKKKGNTRREIVRTAVGNGVKKVKDIGDGVNGTHVTIDASADPHAAGKYHYISDPDLALTYWLARYVAVASHLALYSFNLKTSPPSRFNVNPNNIEPLPEKLTFKPLAPSKEWDEGVLYAEAQNFTRTVRHCPY